MGKTFGQRKQRETRGFSYLLNLVGYGGYYSTPAMHVHTHGAIVQDRWELN